MEALAQSLRTAVSAGHLRAESAANITQLLARGGSNLVEASIGELVAAAAWNGADDRFYRTLAFGTGGLRGRTIGKIVTAAEAGTPTKLGRPEHPCVGTNAMNFYNISRATQGLVTYLREVSPAKRARGNRSS